MEHFGMWVRAVITVALLALAGAWLWVIFGELGVGPSKAVDGSVVDTYQRAKDILLVVLPLLTTALGYWFGAAGKQKAEDQAQKAVAQADKASRKLESVLANSTDGDLLDKAKATDPNAFDGP